MKIHIHSSGKKQRSLQLYIYPDYYYGICYNSGKLLGVVLHCTERRKLSIKSILFLVDIKTMITAFHKGYHEYRLCENNVPQVGKDASVAVTQDCCDEHLLASPEGETR